MYSGWDGPFINVTRKYAGQEFVPNIPQALHRPRAARWIGRWTPGGILTAFIRRSASSSTDAHWDNPKSRHLLRRLEAVTFGDGLLTQKWILRV